MNPLAWLGSKLLGGAALIGCVVLGFLLVTQSLALGKAQADVKTITNKLTAEQRDRKQDRIDIYEANRLAIEALITEQKSITDNYQRALNEADKKLTASRDAAAAARTESDGLRDQAAYAARRIADLATPAAAIREYAATTNRLFDNCQRDYQALAERAQGHANDVAKLLAAWPSNAKSPVIQRKP